MSDKIVPIVETDDWKLGCFMEWRPKNHAETCPTCLGHGEVGGGFHDLEGPRPCPKCFGMTTVIKGPTTPRPELPVELVEHMRRAWWDFTHTQ